MSAIYNDARGELEKFYAAVDTSARKGSKGAAWDWANTAAEHAKNLGVQNASHLLGNGNYPDFTALKEAVANLGKVVVSYTITVTLEGDKWVAVTSDGQHRAEGKTAKEALGYLALTWK